MRISDWSSDVCSSDLDCARAAALKERMNAQSLMPPLRARSSTVKVDSPVPRLRIRTSSRAMSKQARASTSRWEERRAGKEGGRTGSSRWTGLNLKQKTSKQHLSCIHQQY